MSCRIIMDSGGEYIDEMKASEVYRLAPLSIDIDGEVFVDETISQEELLGRIAASPNCPKSSCPSPETYMDLYHCDEKHVYVVAMSAPLSGSYNSAVLGKKLYEEEFGVDAKEICVINSRSASVGQSTICMKIKELDDQGMSVKEVESYMEHFIEEQTIYFVLESLDALRKNGRLTGVKSIIASALNIKPVMSADKEGIITQLSQVRGIKKALIKMVDTMVEEVKNPEEKIIGIAHCNNRERAEFVKNLIEERVNLKDIYIAETSGISTLYASDGGIVIAV